MTPSALAHSRGIILLLVTVLVIRNQIKVYNNAR
jgi:hypothetical protein